jgi:hypothetical protein
MDKKRLLQPEIQSFIKEHEREDLHHLMLQKEKYAHLPLRDIIEQISGRKKAKKKLPTWYKTANILYPSPVSIEQSSSEITAKYKASLFSGISALDLTGGFGVDSFYLAQKFGKLSYVEKNVDLAQIAQHNFSCLQQQNIKTEVLSAESFISHNNQQYGLIYIDPDRRPDEKRVTGFKESEPNLPQLLPELLNISENILVKASPMMDITLGIKELSRVKMVIVLAVENEVKELLFWLNLPNYDTIISCINIGKEGKQVFEYVTTDEQQECCEFALVSQYLYEPNAAILKAGAYNLLCKKFKIKKLHRNTHLYTSAILIKDFPGRIFCVTGEESYNKRKIKPLLNSSKANISLRNFPDTPEQVKKKLALKDGGQQYLFGYRNKNNDLRIAICEKVKFSKP